MKMVVMVVVFYIGNLGSSLHETDTQATDVIFFIFKISVWDIPTS
jgi:hypothetical protein